MKLELGWKIDFKKMQAILKKDQWEGDFIEYLLENNELFIKTALYRYLMDSGYTTVDLVELS